MDRFQDITINDASLKALFISYFLNGQYGQAFNLITNNTQLNTKAFVANVMNEIAGILSSLQENFNDEVILYLENQLSGFQIIIDNYLLKNDYDGSTEYQIYNFVIYNDLIYMYINSDPSSGNLPTDTDYWVEIGLLGQKGEPGIGVNLRYAWDSSVTYNPLDVVYYNNELWVATIQNTNVTPGTETTWQTLTGSIVTVDNPGNYYVGDLVVDINPIQDLHGYDNPWPAGGGKNLFNATARPARLTFADGVYTLNEAPSTNTNIGLGTVYLEEGKSYILSGGYSAAFRVYLVNGSGYPTSNSGDSSVFIPANGSGNYSVYTVVETTATVGTQIKPMVRLSSQPSGFAPYSNICPISGWTGANVLKFKNNLVTGFEAGDYNPSNGEKRTFASRWRTKDKIPVKPGTTVKFQSDVYRTWLNCCQYDSQGAFLRGTSPTIYANPGYAQFVVPDDCYYLAFSSATTTEENATSIQLLYPLTAGADSSFGTIIPISFGSAGTVYGGTLDVTTGELTVTHGIVPDLSARSWTYNTAGAYPYFNSAYFDEAARPASISLRCSAYKAIANINGTTFRASDHDGEVCIDRQSARPAIMIQDSAYSDADAFKASLSGVQLVYELATPQTYQLTPHEVQLLAGENNLWSDTGNIEVEIVERDWEEFLEFSKASLYIDSTSPSSPFEGMIWFDTSLT